jgi:ornithine cyclodeaminase/alanine dehydrogenase
MEANQLLYLSNADVKAIGITMAEVIDSLEAAFREKGEGRTEMPPKVQIHPGGKNTLIQAMPAYIPALQSAGIKWVSGFPENHKKGLPYVSGLLILNDVDSGLPLSVMDCIWITAMRTGAATAVSARYLARTDSSVVEVLGCGVQGRTNVEALNVIFPLKRVMAYDVSDQAVSRYADDIETRFGLEVKVVSTPCEAVAGCDIVVTAGPILKRPHATIQAGWLKEGAFASLVDYDSYWHCAAIKETDKFCTDDTSQFLFTKEKGGYFQDIPEIHADLGELVTGRKPGRETQPERTMTANLGLAIGDLAVAPLLYQKALEKGIGTILPL